MHGRPKSFGNRVPRAARCLADTERKATLRLHRRRVQAMVGPQVGKDVGGVAPVRGLHGRTQRHLHTTGTSPAWNGDRSIRHGAATLCALTTQRRYARVAATQGGASLDEHGHGALTSPPRVRSPCANKLVRGCSRVPRGTSGDARLATMRHARKCFRFPDSIKRRSDCRRRAKNHTGDPVLGVADGHVWKFRAGVRSVASWAASGLG